MALIRRKGLETAERFLKQGKLKAAIAELRQASEGGPEDPLTLNRLGDLLARQGRNAEAIDYYRRIARQFAGSGFLPKAIAMHKKILRLDSQNLDSMVQLGELYVQQNLHGEARNFLLHAANLYLQQKEFDRAGAIFKKLVQAEPTDVRHRVRLAETHAAAGDPEGAGRELIALGDSLVEQGKAVEAEKIFHRAAELLPRHHAPQLGMARALSRQGRAAEALGLLERGASVAAAAPELLGELARQYAQAGRGDDALRVLGQSRPLEIPHATWSAIFALYLARGEAARLWERLDGWTARHGDVEAMAALLEQLAGLEPEGHIPALQRLVDLLSRHPGKADAAHALERLVQAYRARAMHDEASLMLDRLREVAPFSSLVAETPRTDGVPAFTVQVTPAERAGSPLPPNTEAPAVPLKRADEEFAAGRLTQAEVLEKYGLHPQALDQLEEVVNRFPGHVEAQEKRVALLRASRDRQRLGEALAQLAIAQRAAGDVEAARRSAAEAGSVSNLGPEVRQALAQLMLVGAEGAPKAGAATAVAGGAVDLVIDFDSDDAEPAGVAPKTVVSEPAVPVAPRPPARPTRVPSKDMLDEIQHYIEAGMIDEAGRRLSALAALGYASAALEGMAEQVRAASDSAASAGARAPAGPAAAPPTEVEAASETFSLEMDLPPVETEAPAAAIPPVAAAPRALARDVPARIPPPLPLDGLVPGLEAPPPRLVEEDDDLSAITAALEAELFDGETQPLVPEEDPDQSIDDIFAAFKEQVRKEVGSEDYRTHYDLGIAYKEMGLVDEAIQEFRAAIGSLELRREACSMIAMCHRDRGESAEAAHWYREAMQCDGTDPVALSRLRYDLAEVLLEAGDPEAALHEFRDVWRQDPTYRDVQGRISEIEGRLDG